jgi:hypothetical protein
MNPQADNAWRGGFNPDGLFNWEATDLNGGVAGEHGRLT